MCWPLFMRASRSGEALEKRETMWSCWRLVLPAPAPPPPKTVAVASPPQLKERTSISLGWAVLVDSPGRLAIEEGVGGAGAGEAGVEEGALGGRVAFE